MEQAPINKALQPQHIPSTIEMKQHTIGSIYKKARHHTCHKKWKSQCDGAYQHPTSHRPLLTLPIHKDTTLPTSSLLRLHIRRLLLSDRTRNDMQTNSAAARWRPFNVLRITCDDRTNKKTRQLNNIRGIWQTCHPVRSANYGAQLDGHHVQCSPTRRTTRRGRKCEVNSLA